MLIAGVFVATLNLSIDPHARFLLIDRPGFNQAKITLPRNSRTGKANALRQCGYSTIVLGNSRAETAIAVTHPAFRGKKAYNAALRGASVHEMRRMAQYALQQHKLDTVLLSLDFVEFNSSPLFSEDFADSPLADTPSLTSLARYLLSAQTVWQSLITLRQNFAGNVALCTDTGEHQRTYKLEAPRKTFDFILRVYARDQYSNYLAGDKPFEELSELLQELTAKGVRVFAYISPVHVTHLELKTEMGLLDEHEYWKKQLVATFAEANKALAETQKAVLWDFSGYNDITTEKVSPLADNKFMRWYLDSAHANEDAGNLMLDRMFDTQREDPQTTGNFGIQLTAENIDGVLANERRDSNRYRLENPDEIARIRKMLCATQNARFLTQSPQAEYCKALVAD